MSFLSFSRQVNFLLHKVLSGFTSGAAIIIALSQVKHLLRINMSGQYAACTIVTLTRFWSSFFLLRFPLYLSFAQFFILGDTVIALAESFVDSAQSIHPWTVGLGVACIIFILCMRWLHKKIPGSLILLVLLTFLSWILDFETKASLIYQLTFRLTKKSVSFHSSVSDGFQDCWWSSQRPSKPIMDWRIIIWEYKYVTPSFPHFNFSFKNWKLNSFPTIEQLAPSAVAISVLGFIESMSVAKQFAGNLLSLMSTIATQLVFKICCSSKQRSSTELMLAKSWWH